MTTMREDTDTLFVVVVRLSGLGLLFCSVFIVSADGLLSVVRLYRSDICF